MIINCPYIQVNTMVNGMVFVDREKHPDLGDSEWQSVLKAVALYNQAWICPACDEVLAGQGHLHHALVTRNDVRGCAPEVQALIHHQFNVIVMHPGPCHDEMTRMRSAEYLSEIYGRSTVEMWYYALSAHMTSTLPNLWSE